MTSSNLLCFCRLYAKAVTRHSGFIQHLSLEGTIECVTAAGLEGWINRLFYPEVTYYSTRKNINCWYTNQHEWISNYCAKWYKERKDLCIVKFIIWHCLEKANLWDRVQISGFWGLGKDFTNRDMSNIWYDMGEVSMWWKYSVSWLSWFVLVNNWKPLHCKGVFTIVKLCNLKILRIFPMSLSASVHIITNDVWWWYNSSSLIRCVCFRLFFLFLF